MKRRTQLAIVVLLLGLFALWQAGTFDHALVNVGLNAKSCARNGFGATFCGQELTEYRERISRAKEEGQHAGEEAERKIKQSSREAEESARRGYEEAQQRYSPPPPGTSAP